MQQNINTLLAAKLYNLRREHDFVQKQVANGINISQQVYSLLEKGEYNFTDEIIDEVCSFYKIERTAFVDFADRLNIHNSPYAHSQNGTNNSINDISIFNELLKAKDEVIASLKRENELLRKVKN